MLLTKHYFLNEQATKAFLDALSESGANCVTRATAIKFLFARKFDVSRAHALWRQHEATRRREGLTKFQPFEDPLKTELETGKFTILVSKVVCARTTEFIAARTLHNLPDLSKHLSWLLLKEVFIHFQSHKAF